METTISLPLTVFAIGFATLLWLRPSFGRKSRDLDKARQAFDGCERLLGLIKSLQRHRGMSSAWLSGDRSFEGRIAELRQLLERQFNASMQTATLETDSPWPCFDHNDMAMLRHQWQALADAYASMTTEQNIAAHTDLVTKVLGWLAALGEARIELALPDRVAAGVVRNYAMRLPALAECLGQARAVGSSVAAHGKCSPVARVRLMFLASRAEALIAQALAAAPSARSSATARTVEELVEMIRRHLLNEHRVDIGAGDYFDTATHAIDDVFAWIDGCALDLRRALERADAPLEFRGQF
ncbi:MAG TPA: nitrate- and nitrite sensing domain-containing protein [Rhodocyclaceae bacterium]|nr:nitrate- and nitrite sensing domain-containing protein [Rhodocyclaceae bacterium]